MYRYGVTVSISGFHPLDQGSIPCTDGRVSPPCNDMMHESEPLGVEQGADCPYDAGSIPAVPEFPSHNGSARDCYSLGLGSIPSGNWNGM